MTIQSVNGSQYQPNFRGEQPEKRGPSLLTYGAAAALTGAGTAHFTKQVPSLDSFTKESFAEVTAKLTEDTDKAHVTTVQSHLDDLAKNTPEPAAAATATKSGPTPLETARKNFDTAGTALRRAEELEVIHKQHALQAQKYYDEFAPSTPVKGGDLHGTLNKDQKKEKAQVEANKKQIEARQAQVEDGLNNAKLSEAKKAELKAEKAKLEIELKSINERLMSPDEIKAAKMQEYFEQIDKEVTAANEAVKQASEQVTTKTTAQATAQAAKKAADDAVKAADDAVKTAGDAADNIAQLRKAADDAAEALTKANQELDVATHAKSLAEARQEGLTSLRNAFDASKTTDTIDTALDKLNTAATEAATEVTNKNQAARTAAEQVAEASIDADKTLRKTNMVDELMESLTGVKKAAGDAADTVQQAVKNVPDNVKQAFEAIADKLPKKVNWTKAGIGAAVGLALVWIGSKIFGGSKEEA